MHEKRNKPKMIVFNIRFSTRFLEYSLLSGKYKIIYTFDCKIYDEDIF